MEFNEIIEQILLVRRDLKREEILRMVEEKKREAEGYFTDEGAARLVASELGVEVFREPFQPEIVIRDLVSGLNDVTITGRIITVYSPKTFMRPDRTEGKVAHLLIADNSGTLNVVLWDDKVGLVEDEKIREGEIIRILHGYVREGFDGKPELHVGLRGDVQISPPSVTDQEYPPLAHFIQKIGELTKKGVKASISGTVQRINPVSTFQRRDGTQGKVRRLQLSDGTGQITVVLWNDKVDELGDVKTGDHLKVVDSRVKENIDGRLEIHTKNATKIEILRGVLPPCEEKTTKIMEIKEEGGPVTVEGILETAPEIREVTTKRGERFFVASFELGDGTGKIRVSLWRRLVDLIKDLTVGNRIKISNAYVKRGFSDQLELTSRMLTSVEIQSKEETLLS